MKIISQVNRDGTGATWISDLCSRSFQVTNVTCVFLITTSDRNVMKQCVPLCEACQDASIVHIDLLRSPLGIKFT